MDVTVITVDDFRDYYPEFSDETDYTDNSVLKALHNANAETGSKRWGSYSFDASTLKASFKARGLFAFAAHTVALAKASQRATEAGMVASAPARVASKTVGDESVSYAVPTPTATQAAGMGDLNTTIYGQEFMRLRRRAGAGIATTGQVRL